MSASLKVVLYKSKTFTDGKHPVLLRVTINRKLKYYNIDNRFKCFEKQWNKKDGQFNKRFPNHDKANRQIFKSLSKASDIIADLNENKVGFSISDFHKRYESKRDRIFLFEYFDHIIDRQESAGKSGNAEVYRTAKNAFYSFFNNNDSIEISDISTKDLNQFVEKCSGKGLKSSSINNYLRTLRALCNKAIDEEGYEYYPFKNFDWSGLKSQTAKRAISKEDILKIINSSYTPDTEEFDTINMFAFMYLTYGLNFADLAKLKPENIKTFGEIELLEYFRSKGGKFYQIPLNEKAKVILDYYIKKKFETGYIFPILNQHIHYTPQQIKTRIKTALKKFNGNLKDIATELGIKEKVTSYVSRHTFASVLAKQGENILTISEMLGHSDLKTTQIYLKELDNNEKLKASRKLLD